MTGFTLKRRLDAGQRLHGIFVFSPDPASTEMAGRAGFDLVVVDREHTALSWSDVSAHLRAGMAVGTPALVRIAALRPDEVGRALDLGAEGVLLPHFGLDAAASGACARAARFAPEGERGTCTGTRAAGYGQADFAAALREANANALVVAQIEDAAVLPRLGDLLAAHRVDLVMPGLADLATSLGLPGRFAAPEVVEAVEAVETVFETARIRGIPVCGYVADAREAARWRSRDLAMLVHSIDHKLLARAYAEARAAIGPVR